MLVNIHVPGCPTGLPIHINEMMSLTMYSWTDIVSGNIICDPDKTVNILHMEYNGAKLDTTKSLQELGIPESAVITIHCKLIHCRDLQRSCIQTDEACEEVCENSDSQTDSQTGPSLLISEILPTSE